ncbi:hypothetical protein L1987_87306 [Smallanthus sonchifolius]|nr:hypothetical protein L1987_87306 [Smallanthus sonchifolius]
MITILDDGLARIWTIDPSSCISITNYKFALNMNPKSLMASECVCVCLCASKEIKGLKSYISRLRSYDGSCRCIGRCLAMRYSWCYRLSPLFIYGCYTKY